MVSSMIYLYYNMHLVTALKLDGKYAVPGGTSTEDAHGAGAGTTC